MKETRKELQDGGLKEPADSGENSLVYLTVDTLWTPAGHLISKADSLTRYRCHQTFSASEQQR